MIREVKCSLKFSNSNKKQQLDMLFSDYKSDLQDIVNLIITKQLPLRNNLTSKSLPDLKIKHSQWKQIIYKNASEIIRSNLKFTSKKTFNRYKKVYAKAKESGKFKWFTERKYSELKIDLLKRVNINIDKVTISVDQRLLSIKSNDTSFNEFVGVRLPYFKKDKTGKEIKRAVQLNLPIKYHKHYFKYSDWKRNNTIKLKNINGEYYAYFSFEKEKTDIKEHNETIGIDIGYKKLITSSNEKYYGKDIERICTKISRKQRGSKKYLRALTERTNYINEQCNKFVKENSFNHLVVEDLKNVKYKSKLSTKFNNKLQYWSYRTVLDKMVRFSEEVGYQITFINPSYTSQTCSQCNTVLKSNRKGEIYKCSCGLEIDADYNASINILRRGIYSSSGCEEEKVNECNIC